VDQGGFTDRDNVAFSFKRGADLGPPESTQSKHHRIQRSDHDDAMRLHGSLRTTLGTLASKPVVDNGQGNNDEQNGDAKTKTQPQSKT